MKHNIVYSTNKAAILSNNVKKAWQIWQNYVGTKDVVKKNAAFIHFTKACEKEHKDFRYVNAILASV